MRKTIFALCILSAMPSLVSAQSKTSIFVYTAAASADLVTTYRCLDVGCHENNPLGRPFHDNATATVIAGAMGDAAVLFATRKLVAKQHPKLATFGLYVVAGVRGFLAARNMRERVEQIHLNRMAGIRR